MLIRSRTILIPLGAILALLTLHEFGHVWAAWVTGGKVGEIVIFSLTPHVEISTAASRLQEAFRAAAGSATSLLACFGLLAYGGGRSFDWRLARVTAWAFGAVELMGWCLSAVTYTPSPEQDDAARFLSTSGFSALQVLTVCIAIAALQFALFRTAARRADAGAAAGAAKATEPAAKAAAAT